MNKYHIEYRVKDSEQLFSLFAESESPSLSKIMIDLAEHRKKMSNDLSEIQFLIITNINNQKKWEKT